MNCCGPRQPLFKVIDQIFAQPMSAGAAAAAGLRSESGHLPVDVSETDTQVIVRAAAPGFAREEIDAEIHDNVLTIKAEHTEERKETGERYFRQELRSGTLSRRVSLPSDVVAGEVTGELRDGVLTLRIPKAPEATPRKIKIG